MAVDIGIEAVDLNWHMAGEATLVNKHNPAGASGIITSIEVWAYTDLTGFRVGTFYTTNGDTLKCRASVLIGDVTAGAKRTFSELSIAVEAGDYIGCYISSSLQHIEYATAGYVGAWWIDGEHIDPNDEAEGYFLSGEAVSLGGYIEAPGVPLQMMHYMRMRRQG